MSGRTTAMRGSAGPLAVALASAAYFALFVGYGINVEDEGLILLQIARTARGEVPYVDFHTGYTPGTFYVNAALFRWLGETVWPMRWLLVVVNAATVALVHVLARRLAGGGLAAAAALGYAAFLPAFAGDFASFNVPYPSWYAGLFFLLCQLAVDHHLLDGRRRWLVAAGAAAGLAFTFKPNAGVLAALAAGIVLAFHHAGRGDAARASARGLLVAALAAVAAAFGFRVWMPELWLIAGPLVLLLVGRIGWGTASVLPADRLWPAVGWTALGGLAVTAHWVLWFLWRLGPEAFLREILLLGSHADVIYATPYPVPLDFHWPTVVAVALAAAGGLGLAVERERVRARRAVGVLAAGAVLLTGVLWWRARIPEGLVRSIMWQAQHVGFYAVPLLNVALSVVFLRRLRGPAMALGPRAQRLLAALVFAQCMFVELYPRVDTMHLIVAMPSALIVAAAVARRLIEAWSRALDVAARSLRGALLAASAALMAIAVAPGADGLWRAGRGEVVRLRSPHAPVVIEAERGSELRALNATLEWLDARLARDEGVFAFPALALVPFALGRPSLTPHDYFFPGRPDHGDEAEIVARLDADPPRFVVTLNRRLGFFSESPAYYFLLREWVRDRYRLVARFGRWDVLGRRDLPAAPVEHATFEPPPLAGGTFARLADPDREQRRAAIDDVLDRLARGERLEDVASTDRERLLVMRNIAETSDPRGLTPAWRTFETAAGWRVKIEAAGALNFLALRDRLGRHLWDAGAAAEARGAPPGMEALDLEQMRWALMDEDLRLQVGLFAGWVLQRRADPLAGPAFANLVAVERKRPFFQALGAEGLARLGDRRAPCTLVRLLGVRKHETQNTIPSVLIELSARAPEVVAACLAEGLGDARPLAREVSAWVAGAARLAATAPALRAVERDGDEAVREAAAWALARLGTAPARGDE